MIQQFSDYIDQLDLALDQLVLHDRNFDRFAIMLIDNVVELVLHQYAQDRNNEINLWSDCASEPIHQSKAISAALGSYFDEKVKLAKLGRILSQPVADALILLHGFRNSSYHRGLRHEGILHSLALFYFENACTLLLTYHPVQMISCSTDTIPPRALKYLGQMDIFFGKESFDKVWIRLKEVASNMENSLIEDLYLDMEKTIDRADGAISFVVHNTSQPYSRNEMIIDAQVWFTALSEKGKSYAIKNGFHSKSPCDLADWLRKNYPWVFKGDPIPGWRRRLISLRQEIDPFMALNKYCSFMSQTELIRGQLENAEVQVDIQIQRMIDHARGK